MQDKRNFYNILRIAKNLYPEKTSLIESIQGKFDALFETITDRQKLALRSFPHQFIKKIHQEDGSWVSQLHLFAESGVKEVLNIDPKLLSYKNSNGESVLMAYCIGATGTLTGFINHDAIEDMLYKDYSYDDQEKDADGNLFLIKKNTLDEEDFFGQTILDHLIDIAYATGDYSNDLPDDKLQNILEDFSGVNKEAAIKVEEAIEDSTQELKLPEEENTLDNKQSIEEKEPTVAVENTSDEQNEQKQASVVQKPS